MPRREAPRQHLSISLKVQFGGVFWTKFEHFLTKILNDCALRAQNRNALAGKKERGWGEGIFARPRFPPPPNFVSTKLARRLKQY